MALGDTPSAGSLISGRNQHDRFLMGLLRACADAVLLGAGTLRATPGHRWTAEHIFPQMAGAFAELRSNLGRRTRTALVLFTASGDIPLTHPAVIDGATIVTTKTGAEKLEGRLPDSCDVMVEESDGRVDVRRAVDELRSRGYGVLLTEGGPHLMGDLVRAGLLDELFITESPLVAGRKSEQRYGMVAGAELLPDVQLWSRLLSVRRSGDFLFMRYALNR